MTIKVNEETPEQKSAARTAQGERESAILDEIKDGLPAESDLRAGGEAQLGRKGRVQEEQGEGEEEEESSEEDSQDETEETEEGSEEESSETEEGETEGEEEGEEDEELSPESKKRAQKRIDDLTRRNKRLEAELKRNRAAAPEETSTTDPDILKLRAMSAETLKLTYDAIEDQREDALLAGDKEKAKALRVLRDKAHAELQTAPQRFAANQVKRYDEVVRETAERFEEGGRKFDEATHGKIFARAKKIFLGSKNLQASVDGQAEAWQLAVEQYEEVSKFSAGNNRRIESERQVNKLKKKVALSTSTQKGNAKVSDEAKLYNRAKNGTTKDKAAFVRKAFNTDSLIPEQFRRERN